MSLAEIKQFLNHDNPAVQLQALKILSTTFGDQKMIDQIIKLEIPKSLARLISEKISDIVKLALTLLLTLSEQESAVEQLLDSKLLLFLMKRLNDPKDPYKELELSLLANLTRTEAGSRAFMQEGSRTEGLYLRYLIRWLTLPFDSQMTDAYEYAAYTLANVAQVASARDLLLDPTKDLLKSLAPQLAKDSCSAIRQMGLLRAIRNLFMEEENHPSLLAQEMNIYPHFLLPVVGPEITDAEELKALPQPLVQRIQKGTPRDPSTELRRIIMDIVMLCAGHKPSRVMLRSQGIYPVLRDWHKFEQSLQNQEADDLMFELVPYFILDEEPEAGTTTGTAAAAGSPSLSLPEASPAAAAAAAEDDEKKETKSRA